MANKLRASARLALGVTLGLTTVGCKKAKSTEAPNLDIRSLSLDEIEGTLDDNRTALNDAGVYVAMATTPSPTPVRPEDPLPPPVDDGGDTALVEEGAQPTPQATPVPPSEPEPMTSERDYAFEDEAEYEDPSVVKSTRRRRSSRATRREEKREEAERCERVCDLADVACDLEEQICELADRHPEEPRYANACERAELQCEAAQDACDECD